MRAVKANDLIDVFLKQQNEELAKEFKADVLVVRSPIQFGLDDSIRLEIENLCNGAKKQKPRLVVFIETTGGYIEVVERIYAVFRKHYREVDFIVPNYAYSAGTVLVLSGDKIYMDYYSVLGPIDPQIEVEGKFLPGLGYLAKFNELVAEINGAKDGEPKTAELAYLLKRFDPGMLFSLEQAKNHSQTLLEEWLSKHKFKGWRKTEDRGLPVDDGMRRARAKDIAAILSDPERWHSHGRGIGLNDLTGDHIKLKVEDFGKKPELADKIHSYHHLLIDFCQKSKVNSALHSRLGLRRLA